MSGKDAYRSARRHHKIEDPGAVEPILTEIDETLRELEEEFLEH